MSDDRPLGGKGNYEIPESELPETQVEEVKGPLETRVESKVWKMRTEAFTELAELFRKGDDPPFEQYANNFPRYLGDAHPGAQEQVMEAFAAMLEKRFELVIPIAPDCVRALIEKGLTSAKAANKAAAGNLLLLLFENFSTGFEAFAEAIISTLDCKNVKVQAAGVSAVTLVLKDFGPVNLQLKLFLIPLEKLATSSNPAVRTEVMSFFKEAYRWIREAIRPTVDRLKKAQADELIKSFEEITEFPQPTRLNKGQKPPPANAGKGGPQMDAYDLADAKDIFGKYGATWVESVFQMEKWVEKKEAMEELNREADTPKLAERSPQELVTLVKRLLVDNNMNVQLQAIKLAGLLARGQRRYFEPFAKQLFPALLLKLKDKKGPVVQETQTALGNLLKSADFEDFMEDISKLLEDKAPHAKMNAAALIDRVTGTLPAKVKARIGRDLAVMIKKNVNDSSADVRDTMIKSLGMLKARVSAEAVSAVIGDLPAAKLQKLEEVARGFAEEAGDDPEPPAAVVSAPAQQSRPAPGKKAELIVVEDEVKEAQSPKPPPAKGKPPAKRPATAKPEETKSAPSKSAAAQSKDAPEDEASAAITPEEAEQRLTGVLPDSVMTGLTQAGWKEKQSALQELIAWIGENGETASELSEALARHVRVRCKDWKENNFNVVKAAFETFLLLTQSCNLTKRGAAMVLNAAALEKLAEAKVLETYMQLFSAISESLSPRFVSGLIIKGTSESGKPKVIVESCNAMSRLLVEFGAHTMNVKDLIDYGKNCINNTNPTIKKAGQSLLVTLYSFMGDTITNLLTDVKEATMKVLQAEFATTEVRKNTQFKAVKGEEQKSLDPRKALDDAIPRNNIGNLITSKMMKDLGDANWKTRKETMDAIDEVLTSSGMRILPTGLNDVIKGLKGRLTDPNKSLARQSMALVGRFAEALGSECKQFNKFLVPGLLGNLADKQSLLRQDAIAAIDKWAKEAGPEAIIQYSATTLQQENPELRSELINWLLAHKENLKNCELEPFLPAVLMCLQDRVAGIRNGGELLLAEVISVVGFEAVTPYLKDIKPAIVNTLKPIIDKYRTGSSSQAEEPPAMATPSKKEPGARPHTAKVVKASSTRSLADPSQDAPPLGKPKSANVSEDIALLAGGKKEKRLEQEMRCKWTVEELRLDYVERLNEQLRVCVSPDLYTKMFASDFKKQVEALTHLSALLISHRQLFLETLDLIIKWIFVKMMDVTINTQVMKGILELSVAMLAVFDEDKYPLHQVEAELFLMIMCEKSGHNNATFRTQIRSIMHSCTKICAPTKVFNCVLQGVNSKNNRSKVECLEELGSLVLDFGTSVYQPRDIKAIAKFVSHTDGSVRLAAVGAIAEVYKYLDDRVWGLIGEVNDKAKEMLEQRFRAISGNNTSLSKTAPNKPQGKVDSGQVGTPRKEKAQPKAIEEPKSFVEAMMDKSIPSPKNDTSDSKIPDVDYHPEELGRPETLLYQDFDKFLPEVPMESARPNILTQHIHTLLNQDMSAQVDSLVSINDVLIPNVDQYVEDFKEKGSHFLEAITKVMIQTFDKPVVDVQIRFAKYFLSVVHKICSAKVIMMHVSENTLYILSEQVLRDLLIEDLDKLGERGEGELMLKTLNGTMLRILENCQATSVFVVLIRLLKRYKNDQFVPKMSGLVIRCLLKLTKILGNLKADLEVGRLLLAMHEYLIEHKSTSATDEMGTKTIKTILNELVKLEGERIWEAYEAVRRHPVSDENIERWIRMINTSLGPAPPISYQRLRSPPRAAGLPQELVDIYMKLKAAETYDDGIRLLYGYTERNPGTDLKTLPVELQKRVDEDIQRLRTRAVETKAPSRFSLEQQARGEVARDVVRPETRAGEQQAKPAFELPRPVTASPTDPMRTSTDGSLRPGNENQEPESGVPFRIQDFQDRLAMMKKRYGLMATGDKEQPTASLSDLKTKVNSLLAPDSRPLLNDMKSRLDTLKKQ